MAELLEHETWMQKVPRQMYQVGRSNLILITKWLPCQKALILHKMCEELKKKRINWVALEINSTALNCFSCWKSHISIISCMVCQGQLVLAMFKGDNHKSHLNHRFCYLKNSCVRLHPGGVAILAELDVRWHYPNLSGNLMLELFVSVEIFNASIILVSNSSTLMPTG